MTLREKLTTKEAINTQGEAGRFADKSVIIAEEFAIGFCIWLADEQTNLDTTYKKEHFEELLEIYKKTL